MTGGLLNYQMSKEQMLLNAAMQAESRGEYAMAVTYLKALANLQKIELDKMPISDPRSVRGQLDLKAYYCRCLPKLMGETGDKVDDIRASFSNPFSVKSGGKK